MLKLEVKQMCGFTLIVAQSQQKEKRRDYADSEAALVSGTVKLLCHKEKRRPMGIRRLDLKPWRNLMRLII